jgi:hypothetical protein
VTYSARRAWPPVDWEPGQDNAYRSPAYAFLEM